MRRIFENIQIYNFSPNNWLALSIMQLNNRIKTENFSPPAWLILTTYPLSWFAGKFGMGEELTGTGQKTAQKKNTAPSMLELKNKLKNCSSNLNA